jgi:hypothetical protein
MSTLESRNSAFSLLVFSQHEKHTPKCTL